MDSYFVNLITILFAIICVFGHQNQNYQNLAQQPGLGQGQAQGQGQPQAPTPVSVAELGLDALWDKYGKHDFMHDLDHLKEETNKLLYLQESDQITIEQSAFFYTRLHDFNSDSKLDGLELLLAVKHSLVHQNSTYEAINLEELSGYVDGELRIMDSNNDGFIDYGEIYTYMQLAKKSEAQKNSDTPS